MKRVTVLSLFLLGCYSNQPYRVDADVAARVLAASPEDLAHHAVPAVRVRKNRAVRLSAPDARRGLDAAGGALDFTTRRYNRMATAGVVMTFVGTAISAAGTILFFLTDSGPVHIAGAALAGTAEPVMLTGTGLWIGGLARPPDEVRDARVPSL